jgi:hypothetical protein
MIRHLPIFLFAASACVMADTVIMYDDGSTYTLKPSEEVYVAAGDLYKRVSKVKATPNRKRDYVPPEPSEDDACWPWAGIAPPPGYSIEACVVQEEEEESTESCDENGLGFGHGC